MPFESYPITLDGLTLAWQGVTEFPDDVGNSLICTKLEGWQGSPAARLQQTDRPGADGVFDGAAYRGARQIALDGRYFSTSDYNRAALERRLAAICVDPTRLYPLGVTDPAGALTAYVRRSSEVLAVSTNWNRGELSVGLSAPDPLLQSGWISATIPAATPGSGGIVSTTGIVSTSPGIAAGTAPSPTTVTVTNPGTAPAILVAEFDGATTSPSILRTDNGAEVKVTGAVLEAGQSLYVNLSHHYAHDVPGQSVGSFMYGRSIYGPSGYAGGGGLTVVNGVWPELGPGETATFLITGGGPGTLHVRPTYW